jgi:hypothetical protein
VINLISNGLKIGTFFFIDVNIEKMYRFTLSIDQLKMNKGTALINAGMSKVLSKYYKYIDPELKDALDELHAHSCKSERRLLTILNRIFCQGDKRMKRKRKNKYSRWTLIN